MSETEMEVVGVYQWEHLLQNLLYPHTESEGKQYYWVLESKTLSKDTWPSFFKQKRDHKKSTFNQSGWPHLQRLEH